MAKGFSSLLFIIIIPDVRSLAAEDNRTSSSWIDGFS